MANTVERIMKKTGLDEDSAKELLEDAEAWILGYTNRKRLPAALEPVQRELAIIAFNRDGTEGESARSEAGESYTFNDIPEHIYAVLNRFRLARVGGRTYENEN